MALANYDLQNPIQETFSRGFRGLTQSIADLSFISENLRDLRETNAGLPRISQVNSQHPDLREDEMIF